MLYEVITEYIYSRKPEDFAPALLLAELYLVRKHYTKAAAILEKLIETSPDDYNLLQMYAETAQKAGNPEKALQAAEKLTGLKHGDDDTEIDIDKLNQNLDFYDDMAEKYALEYGNRWNKNLKALAGSMEYAPKDIEEESFILEGLQDIRITSYNVCYTKLLRLFYV